MVKPGKHRAISTLAPKLAVTLMIIFIASGVAFSQNGSSFFFPKNLVVSRSVYDNNPNTIVVGVTALPPNCSSASGSCTDPPTTAINDGTYPYVWNNDTVDSSFGITSKIFLDQITTSGSLINTLEVPNSLQNGVPPTKDQMVTSFSSKSELALNLSTDTSTVSGNGDQGADPNKLVAITDSLAAGGPSAPNGETFTTLRSAGNLEVLRGVSFGPGTGN
jgi:hypothetical protein